MAARFSFWKGEKLSMKEMPRCIPPAAPHWSKQGVDPEVDCPCPLQAKADVQRNRGQPKPTVVERHKTCLLDERKFTDNWDSFPKQD